MPRQPLLVLFVLMATACSAAQHSQSPGHVGANHHDAPSTDKAASTDLKALAQKLAQEFLASLTVDHLRVRHVVPQPVAADN